MRLLTKERARPMLPACEKKRWWKKLQIFLAGDNAEDEESQNSIGTLSFSWCHGNTAMLQRTCCGKESSGGTRQAGRGG
jgi:hypothetical protein